VTAAFRNAHYFHCRSFEARSKSQRDNGGGGRAGGVPAEVEEVGVALTPPPSPHSWRAHGLPLPIPQTQAPPPPPIQCLPPDPVPTPEPGMGEGVRLVTRLTIAGLGTRHGRTPGRIWPSVRSGPREDGGAAGETYVVTSTDDDPINPKEGTLRWGVTRVSA